MQELTGKDCKREQGKRVENECHKKDPKKHPKSYSEDLRIFQVNFCSKMCT